MQFSAPDGSADAEERLAAIKHFLESMPPFNVAGQLSREDQLWLARVHALLEPMEAILFRSSWDSLTSQTPALRTQARNSIFATVYRQFGIAEKSAPSHLQGAFIAVGNAYDAISAIGAILRTANASVRIIDPYMDKNALDDFAILASEKLSVQLLAWKKKSSPALIPSVKAWRTQYGSLRPLEARLSTQTLHDRLIIIDDKAVYILTQSLNSFAVRSPAAISKVSDDIAALKLAAYEEYWMHAEAIA